MKKSTNLLHIVTASLLAALCCVATMVIQIPTPTGGFVNLGDTVIVLASALLSPVYAFLAAGIGSALSDILAGYPHYAAATFVIKGFMALAMCLLLRAFCKISKEKDFFSIAFTAVSALCGEVIMVGGYFLFEATVLSYGMGAAASVIPNMIQGAVGILGGTILTTLVRKTRVHTLLQ